MAGFCGRIGGIIVAAAALGACSGLPSMGGLRSSSGGGDYAAGSPVSDRLSSSERDALGEAFVKAMDEGAPVQWRGKRAAGVVMPGNYALANLQADPNARIPAVRADLDLAHVMETDLGPHVLTRNSNIRIGPGTENTIAEVVPSGSGVDVVGRIDSKSWMLIAIDGAVRGYVFENLLIKAPGTELELAGGPLRRTILCREFTQRASVLSERHEWRGAACNDGAGWRMAPPEPENLIEQPLEF
jgi:hypothetical protein